MNPWVRIAIAVARVWTAVYTWRLPQPLRERRRGEIESDLWESRLEEPHDATLALHIVARLVRGVSDDVRWRVEQASAPSPARRLVAMAVGAAALVACVWVAVNVSRVDPPQPPQAPELDWRHRNRPAPPPPPPPPCNPPGIGRPAFSPCTPY
jgi:hypothetical protein